MLCIFEKSVVISVIRVTNLTVLERSALGGRLLSSYHVIERARRARAVS
jgi:hypothetical protein